MLVVDGSYVSIRSQLRSKSLDFQKLEREVLSHLSSTSPSSLSRRLYINAVPNPVEILQGSFCENMQKSGWNMVLSSAPPRMVTCRLADCSFGLCPHAHHILPHNSIETYDLSSIGISITSALFTSAYNCSDLVLVAGNFAFKVCFHFLSSAIITHKINIYIYHKYCSSSCRPSLADQSRNPWSFWPIMEGSK